MDSLSEQSRQLAQEIFGRTVPLLVEIAGPTCSGKSSLAKQLPTEAFIQPYSVGTLGLDDYMRNHDDERLPRLIGKSLYDHPQSFHTVEYFSDVRCVMSGGNISAPIYDTANNRRCQERRLVTAPQVLITEGLFTIQLLSYLTVPKFTIYLDVPPAICLERRIKRDTVLYGVTPERVEEVFWTRVWPIYEPFGEVQKQLADLVLPNN